MTRNMIETYHYLKEHGFMATREETNELLVRNQGLVDGAAAGSWVIDGNTSDETCRRTLHGLDIGDPQVHDALPGLCLGEWAGDPEFHEILDEIGIEHDEDTEDDLWRVYAEAWSEGMVSEVERACSARVTPDVTQTAATSDE